MMFIGGASVGGAFYRARGAGRCLELNHLDRADVLAAQRLRERHRLLDAAVDMAGGEHGVGGGVVVLSRSMPTMNRWP